jgi:hypothetical protein
MAISFSKIHINYISTAPIFEIITSPNSLTEPFNMLKNIQNYSDWYKKIFVQTYLINKDGGNSNVKYPYIKKLGRFLPVSGYETRNIPLYRGAGGNINLVVKRGRWMLPQKLLTNWKLYIVPEIIKKFNISDYSIKPQIHLYPFGMASYQFKTYFEFKSAIQIDELIEFLKTFEENLSITTQEKKFTPIELNKELHKQILQNILKQQVDPLDHVFSNMHRIITINKMNGEIHPRKNKKELFGIIDRTANWSRMNDEFVNDKVRYWIDGIFRGQFFLFDPSSSIILPLDVADCPKFHGYVRKRMRRHFSSLIEFATIQSQFSKLVTQEIQELLESAKNSEEKKMELKELVKRLNDIGWIRTDWEWELQGGHRKFYNKIIARMGLEKNLKNTNEKLKEAEKFLYPDKKMVEIKIDGQGNVVTVGDNNVITVMNQKFKGTDKEEIGKEIALLRGEIQSLLIDDKIKKRLSRTTENLEDEVLDSKPDAESIADQLKTIKEDLEKTGIEVSKSSSLGEKLKKIGMNIAKFAPKIIPIISAFL